MSAGTCATCGMQTADYRSLNCWRHRVWVRPCGRPRVHRGDRTACTCGGTKNPRSITCDSCARAARRGRTFQSRCRWCGVHGHNFTSCRARIEAQR